MLHPVVSPCGLLPHFSDSISTTGNCVDVVTKIRSVVIYIGISLVYVLCGSIHMSVSFVLFYLLSLLAIE